MGNASRRRGWELTRPVVVFRGSGHWGASSYSKKNKGVGFFFVLHKDVLHEVKGGGDCAVMFGGMKIEVWNCWSYKELWIEG